MATTVRPWLRAAFLAFASLWGGLSLFVFFLGGPSEPWLLVFLLVSSMALAFAAIWLAPERFRTAYAGVFLALTIGWCFLGSTATYGGHSKESAKRAACISNTKQIALVFLMYAADHDDRLPYADAWVSAMPADKLPMKTAGEVDFEAPGPSILRCPNATTPGSYAMNAALSAIKQSAVAAPENTVLLFEADANGQNAADNERFFVGRHAGKGALAFVDGHARSEPSAKALAHKWRP